MTNDKNKIFKIALITLASFNLSGMENVIFAAYGAGAVSIGILYACCIRKNTPRNKFERAQSICNGHKMRWLEDSYREISKKEKIETLENPFLGKVFPLVDARNNLWSVSKKIDQSYSELTTLTPEAVTADKHVTRDQISTIISRLKDQQELVKKELD